MENVILGVIVFVPLLLTYFWKSNAPLAFLSVCAGYVLAILVAPDLRDLLKHFGLNSLSIDTVGLISLTVPPAVTLLLARGSHSKSLLNPSFLLQALTALATGGFYVLIAEPFINGTTTKNFSSTWVWDNLQKAQAEVIGIGVLVSLLAIWLGRAPHSSKHHK